MRGVRVSVSLFCPRLFPSASARSDLHRSSDTFTWVFDLAEFCLCIEHVLKCLPKLHSQGNKQLNRIITPLVPRPMGSRDGCVDEMKNIFQGSGFLPNHLFD